MLYSTKGGYQTGDGGAWVVPYKASQLKFATELSDKEGKSLIKFVRVGENGESKRSYTTCCGTLFTGFVLPQVIALNRNAIKNIDGSSFELTEVP